MIITFIENYWFMEYTVNLYLQNNYQNYGEKWLSSIVFCIGGLKYLLLLWPVLFWKGFRKTSLVVLNKGQLAVDVGNQKLFLEK